MTDPTNERVIDPGRPALGWRWMGQPVEAERSMPIAGGLAATAPFATAEGIGRRRRRGALRQLAEPRWRPLGALWVVRTNLRLAVWHDGAWSSVWFGSASDVEPLPDGVILRFAGEPDYAVRWTGQQRG